LWLGGGDLGAKMFERLVGRCVGERVEANGQAVGFLIRNEIDLGTVDGAQQTASIIMAAHRLAYDLRHGRLGSIGEHFDGVDEVLALCAQTIEARICGEVFIRNVALRGLALSLELIDFFL
jgi:hypothetical protein